MDFAIIDAARTALKMASDLLEAGDRVRSEDAARQVVILLAEHLVDEGDLVPQGGRVAIALRKPIEQLVETACAALSESQFYESVVTNNKPRLTITMEGEEYALVPVWIPKL